MFALESEGNRHERLVWGNEHHQCCKLYHNREKTQSANIRGKKLPVSKHHLFETILRIFSDQDL